MIFEPVALSFDFDDGCVVEESVQYGCGGGDVSDEFAPFFQRPGGLYHVLNRGNYRNWIFETDGAKQSFEKSLFESCERAGATRLLFDGQSLPPGFRDA